MCCISILFTWLINCICRWDEWKPSKKSSNKGSWWLDSKDAYWLYLHCWNSSYRRKCAGKSKNIFCNKWDAMCRVIYFVSVVQLQHGKSHLQTGIFSDLVLTKQVVMLFKFWVKFKRIHVNEELVDFNGPCNQTLCNAIK